jgi:hydroxylysine kinase
VTVPSSSSRRHGQRLLDESGLAASHEPVDEAVVSRVLERDYVVRGRLERLATEKDDTFRATTGSRSWLVKVAPPSEPETVVHLQTAAMRFLERVAPGVPAQRVRLTGAGADHVVLPTDRGPRILRVLDFVDGAMWSGTHPDAMQVAAVGATLGQVDLALAGFDHPAAHRELAWDLRHFHTMAGLVEHTPDREHRRLAQDVFRLFGRDVVPRLDDLESQVIHGDYSPHNVVVDPRSDRFVIGVIDFGDTMHSAVIFEPAVAMANLLGRAPGQPWAEACAFVAGYDRARPLRVEEIPLLPVAALARLALRALITNWRAERVPDRREYLLSHARDDWTNLQRAMDVPLGEVVRRLLESRGREDPSTW